MGQMSKEELLLRRLCVEITEKGVQTERFTELWLATGVNLDSCELEIANRILQRADGLIESSHLSKMVH